MNFDEILHPLPFASDAVCFLRAARLSENGEQSGNCGQKGNPFNKRSGKDHVGTNVISSFWLARYGFHCTLTDLAYTNTGTDCSEPCTNGSKTRLSFQQNSHQSHDTWFL